jgi:hypothetical protein
MSHNRKLQNRLVRFRTYPVFRRIALSEMRAYATSGTIRCMACSVLAASMCTVIALVSCCQPSSVQRLAGTDASALKDRIPPAKPNRYHYIVDASHWQNPYLMVHANGVEVLEKLPDHAWPYGLVVGVSESGVRAPGDDPGITRNREELLRLLREAGVTVELWPSS